MLFFYIAGQLVSGLVMFETMLGLELVWSLLITAVVLVEHVVAGGTHADILTDGVQGFMMLIVAIITIGMFFAGLGVAGGGWPGRDDRLAELDENLVSVLNTSTPLYHSWWSIVATLLAHIPLGLLPHIGNKLWALENDGDRYRFVKLAYGAGLTLGLMGVGGLLARAVLGDSLLMDMNIALLVWVGSGGMMAAFAGPLVMGALWRGITAAGAYSGLITGMTTFILLHSGVLPDSGLLMESCVGSPARPRTRIRVPRWVSWFRSR